MAFTVVTVETELGDRVELALPLDVPSRVLAAKIMRDLGRSVRTGEAFDFFIDTGHGDKPIGPTATLGQMGITDGQHLRIRRQTGRIVAAVSEAHAYLRTEAGKLLPLESSFVVIGRKDVSTEMPLDLDLAPEDPGSAVSRRHAGIGREGRSYYLIDLHSTNGTRLNDKDVRPGSKLPLQEGDRIEFGRGVRLTFVKAPAGAGIGDGKKPPLSK